MNEQIRSILAQETTKTSKIRQLYLLGVPRAEIARMANKIMRLILSLVKKYLSVLIGNNIKLNRKQ